MDKITSKLKLENNKVIVELKSGIVEKKNYLDVEKMKEKLKNNNFMEYYNSVGGRKSRDCILEDKMSFVPMAYAFYYYLATQGTLPTTKEFANFFILLFCEEKDGLYHFKENYSTKTNYYFRRRNLEAKLCRAYNSYVRELFLLLTLHDLQNENEEFANLKISYDLQTDVYKGVDILIEDNGRKIGLLVTQNSKNSLRYNFKKVDHRHTYDYDDYIYVRMGEAETEVCGETEIFTKNVGTEILDMIKIPQFKKVGGF